jgi:hypothetical protein
MGCVVTAGVGQVITSYLPLPFPSTAKLSVHNTMSLQGIPQLCSFVKLSQPPATHHATTVRTTCQPKWSTFFHNAGPGTGEAGSPGRGAALLC